MATTAFRYAPVGMNADPQGGKAPVGMNAAPQRGHPVRMPTHNGSPPMGDSGSAATQLQLDFLQAILLDVVVKDTS